jgi:hypothetical protein
MVRIIYWRSINCTGNLTWNEMTDDCRIFLEEIQIDLESYSKGKSESYTQGSTGDELNGADNLAAVASSKHSPETTEENY